MEINLSNNYFIELFPKENKNNKRKNFNIKNVIFLDISGNQIVNLKGITYFSKLKKLNIKENSISKIDSLDKMNQLNYINVSFNKLRNCDKTNIGNLPSLKIFLCDNNYLKDINCFEKFHSIEILSFNNNKVTNLDCLERLNQLKSLKQLSLINNPITKTVNYRKTIFYMFQNLKILDNKEISLEEKENEQKDSQLKEENSFRKQKNIFNINNNNKNNSSSKKINKPRLNYVQIGFKRNLFLSLSQRKFEIKKKTRNKSHIKINEKLLKYQINNKDYKLTFFLSNRNKFSKYLFPSIRKCNTIGKKKDVSKVKNNSRYNDNGSAILFSNEKQNKIYQRPQSATRISSFQYRSNKYIYHNQDYFSIVLNSVNNDNNISPLITLKNWNIRKIIFDNRNKK